MESLSPLRFVSFAVLRTRLLAHITTRIHNGEFSERALARQLGISQPQLHNVLKGARRLQPEFADLLLESFQLSLTSLLTEDEILEEVSGRQLELFSSLEAPAAANQPETTRKKPHPAARRSRLEWQAS